MPVQVPFVPVCGWTGDNLVDRPKATTQLGWYEGPTLLEALDAVETPKRLADKPLRLPVQVGYQG